MNQTKKLELTITALKQSLGNKVANAEEEIASIRAEASLLLEEQAEQIAKKDERIATLENELSQLKGEGNVAVSSEDA
ncbi:hypothetical protein SEA_ANNADREAMY_42 [Streptomyces phage Annadreamy]|uniref:Uncharacterized protein n=2 Tax=Annadreamyvirus annadreamy TaxID=2846392 RepID=A0A345GT91_9CAUD|nr:hypothetical protein HWB75_gp204 [Streptomyces phage Annadreamy]AXG66163.1 hypothetical protein SEA_ANNADREAMY_42 [Streptomyces phage Annadreamy]QGH79375.1 hypothetical protein SEA_LIMPID_42 [Streptomyces phage Limpid]